MTSSSHMRGRNGGGDCELEVRNLPARKNVTGTVTQDQDSTQVAPTGMSCGQRFAVFLIVLSVAFMSWLIELVRMASGDDLFSYIILVPGVFVWLLYLRRRDVPTACPPSFRWGTLFLILGFVALLGGFSNRATLDATEGHWVLAWRMLAFDLLVVAGGFIFLGARAMRTLAFPFAFLIFLVPLPDQLVGWLETASQAASTEVAGIFFAASGTPVLRDGNVFLLPGITIQVAQECSGIHSSLVLFMTSVLAGYVFLKNPWHRLVIVGFAIALGIVRNGLRILVIGLLCVHGGPEMIDSAIHRRGGPVFFAFSLAPFLLALLWLRRRESPPRGRGKILGLV